MKSVVAACIGAIIVCLLVAIACVVILLTRPAPQPVTGTVVGGGGDGVTVGWLDVAPCEKPIHSWPDVAVYCDLSKAVVVVPPLNEFATYKRGDQYPKATPS